MLPESTVSSFDRRYHADLGRLPQPETWVPRRSLNWGCQSFPMVLEKTSPRRQSLRTIGRLIPLGERGGNRVSAECRRWEAGEKEWLLLNTSDTDSVSESEAESEAESETESDTESESDDR